MIVPFQFALRECFRFRKIIPWILLGLCAFILAIVWQTINKSASPTDRFVNVANLLVFRLLPLAAAIYSTAIISQEVEQKTIVYLLTRPIQRWKLILGRWAASASAIIIFSMFGLLMTLLGVGGSVKLSLVNDVLAIVLGTLAYSSLFLFITLLFNRAIIICVLFAFGWESSIPNLPSGLQQLSILAHMQGIAKHPNSRGGNVLDIVAGILGENKMNAMGSSITLIIFSVVMLGVSAYWFTTHEYVPREDAE
jgi:ABC-2 type transport system permease protein